MSEWHNLEAQIQTELENLRSLRMKYSGLLDRAVETKPNEIELLAIANILHSFYGGVENVLSRIERTFDQNVVKSGSWHAELLKRAAIPTDMRPAIIDEDLYTRLREYLGFRHVSRTHYSFELKWAGMENLARSLPIVASRLQTKLEEFLGWLKDAETS